MSPAGGHDRHPSVHDRVDSERAVSGHDGTVRQVPRRWRWSGAGGIALVALLAGGCSSGSATPAPVTVPARDGTCVARTVIPATCFHVTATVHPGVSETALSRWVGRNLGSPGALDRYDLHDCALPSTGGVGLVCTFWPGAPGPLEDDLVQRLDGAHLFTSVGIAAPGTRLVPG